jgi:protein-S-isoprenylcysteine O-methyltransferase Ste14
MASDKSDDTVQLVAIPPVVYVGAFGLGLLIHRLRPLTLFPRTAARVIGAVLFLVGYVTADSAILALWRARTDILTRRPTTTLIVTGPFRFTRHPIYVGMTLMYGGAAVLLNTLAPLLLLPALIMFVKRGAIDREEAYLERRFGEAYASYKGRVRRWI